MSTVRSLVNRAHRYLQTYGTGETPNDDDADIGLEDLKALLRQMISKGVFGPLTDVYTDVAYTAGENERITKTGTPTITIPTTITDDCTGDDRAPEDRAVIIVTPDVYRLYDANQGAWVAIEILTLDSAEPFYAFNLAWLLAEQMAESFNLQPGPIVVAKAETTRAALRLKKPIRVNAPYTLRHLHANRGFC